MVVYSPQLFCTPPKLLSSINESIKCWQQKYANEDIRDDHLTTLPDSSSERTKLNLPLLEVSEGWKENLITLEYFSYLGKTPHAQLNIRSLLCHTFNRALNVFQTVFKLKNFYISIFLKTRY